MNTNWIDYYTRGNYRNAIIVLKQLVKFDTGIVLADHTVALGNLYCLSGDYETGKEILQPIVNGDRRYPGDYYGAYYCLAGCEMGMKHYKQALKNMDIILKYANGVPKGDFADMYCRKGSILNLQHKQKQAIDCWTEGISKYPWAASNYLAATNAYLNTDNKAWGLIYGEMYLAVTKDTAGADNLKQALFAGWKDYFATIADLNPKKIAAGTEKDIYDIFLHLTPVVSDGITTENLTMVRTRFLIEWIKTKHEDNRTLLFAYHDYLIREGWFDIYNEWLFGKAEHAGEFDAWSKFHAGDLERFEQWKPTGSGLPLNPNLPKRRKR